MCSSWSGSVIRSTQTADGELWSHDVRALLTLIKCCSVSSAARSHVNVSAKARAATPSDATSSRDSARRRIAAAMARDVAVRHEKAGHAVAHRLANARRVGRDDRRCARGSFEVRDAPALLGRCKHRRPRATKQRELLRLRDPPKKPHPASKVKRLGERLELGAIVAGAGDLEDAPPARPSRRTRE